MIRAHDILLVSILGVAASSASGQGSVWVVDASGGGDFTTSGAAVAAASAGDTLLFRAGTYERVELVGKGLALVADEGATVRISSGGFCGYNDGLLVENLPAGERVLARGIAMDWISLSDNLGSVWIEDSKVGPHCTVHALLVNHCGNVVLTRSTFEGYEGATGLPIAGTRALSATDASIFAHACTFAGGKGYPGADGSGGGFNPWDAGVGTSAAWLSDIFLFLGGCTVTGGAGGDGESAVEPCADPGDGGEGVHFLGSIPSDVRFLDSAISGGAAGTDPTPVPVCVTEPASDGAAWGGTPGTVAAVGTTGFLALSATSPVREGQSLTVELDGPPNVPSFLAFGTAPDALFDEALFGAIHVAPPWAILVLGTTDATGHAQKSLPVGFLPAGWEAAHFFGQTAYVTGAGVLVLGGTSAVTVLDETL